MSQPKNIYQTKIQEFKSELKQVKRQLFFSSMLRLLVFLLVAFSTFAQDVKLSPLTLESSLKEGADSVVKNESLTLDLSNSNYLTYKVYRVVYVYNKVTFMIKIKFARNKIHEAHYICLYNTALFDLIY